MIMWSAIKLYLIFVVCARKKYQINDKKNKKTKIAFAQYDDNYHSRLLCAVIRRTMELRHAGAIANTNFVRFASVSLVFE